MYFSELAKTASFYTIVDVATKATQAVSVLALAAIFSKSEFGSFAILSAAMQLLSVVVLGGVVEIASPLLTSSGDKAQRLHITLVTAFLIVVRRLAYVIPTFALALLVLSSGLVNAVSIIDPRWLVVFATAGILNGCANVYIPLLTCAGEHRRSIEFRAKLIIGQSAVGLSLAAAFNNINYYGIALLAVPLLLSWNLLKKVSWPDFFSALPKQTIEVNYFLVNALVNWLPWYGLTFAIGLLLGKSAAAEYALVTNIASVMLLAAGGFSQAFVPLQFQPDRSSADQKVGKVIALQVILLSLCALLLLVFYKGLTASKLIGSGYDDLQLKVLVSLFSIVISSAYFITVSLYSLNGNGRQLVNISLISCLLAAIGGGLTYVFSEGLFPYIFFAVFFITRGWLVCKKSGYIWSGIYAENRPMIMMAILAVVASAIACLALP